jgi:cell division septum initiation protein DivIVA
VAESTASQLGEETIPRNDDAKRTMKRRVDTRSAAARPVARELASLALAWSTQGRELRVRQRERLRRALTAAADFLGWSTLGRNRVEIAILEMETLANAGVRSVADDLERELKEKRTELPRLRKTAEALHALADETNLDAPVEFSYCHTARQGDELVTKTETVTIADDREATEAAQAIERRLDAWDKLRVQMVDELKQQRRRVEEMSDSLSEFASSQRSLVREVFAILY